MKLPVQALEGKDLQLYRYRDGMLEQVSEGLLEDDDIALICPPTVMEVLGTDAVEYIITTYPDPEEELRGRAVENGVPEPVTIYLERVGGGEICQVDEGPDDDGRYDCYA